ncbi:MULTISPECIES: hypothetical protein [Okeania]|uniref:Uncharacterized protein n=1 Tax=Okeania hirsuta TaxID=1458930 RepID=A0A3N6QAB8_9CYAN|nr:MULTISPECIES: hypothetical protein [Okeania]NET17421.1 hypothetical protein [Okeania sp. SIO1H6]NES77822.1 hypothetical protein [Okeania sp. SIO1H4]NES93471.1 hypothetical protein [Okeania sp. SIO2B9]NET22822.1 hypothetical protein [Okeania sp. SIO1H5]NET79300.1 hypothetical protein [Okeania sp. SIO1F9]
MPQLWEEQFWHDQKDPHISVASQQFAEGQTHLFDNSVNHVYSQVHIENIWSKAMQQILMAICDFTASANALYVVLPTAPLTNTISQKLFYIFLSRGVG